MGLVSSTYPAQCFARAVASIRTATSHARGAARTSTTNEFVQSNECEALRHVAELPGGSEVTPPLKAPFPWFGGKRRVAPIVWERLGNVDVYCEPFA